MDSNIGFEMSLIVFEAIRRRYASFVILTARVSEIFGRQTRSSILVVGETGASPPSGHVRHMALTSLQLFFGNSGNMTLLHMHQCTSREKMRLACQKQKH